MPNSKYSLSVICKLTLVSLLTGLFLVPNPGMAKASPRPETKYIIKLKNLSLLPNLKNPLHLFSFNKTPAFKNIYSFSSDENLGKLKNDLKGYYEYLEPDRDFITQAAVTPNDPGFTSNPQDIDKQWGLPKTGFNAVWPFVTGTNKNIVALIDTGVDATHEDLMNINFVTGFNAITHQLISGPVNSDDNGHGTLVAGILGATPNNGVGIVGTNWQISLMPIKALDSSGRGNVGTVSESIVWAADHGAQFINLSIGGGGFGQDSTLADAISYAFNKNIVIVAAAGNDAATTGGNLDQNPVYPVCDDNNANMIIGVAASDQNDLKPEFSNFGKNCIDVMAPGKRILSTINYDPLTKTPAPNAYAYASGTSLAVPFVVGEAAIIKTYYPFFSNTQIRDLIISSADPVDNLNLTQCASGSCRGLLGAGRINVSKALEPSSIYSQTVTEGDLIKTINSSVIYQLVGGQKRIVSPFVINQRFAGVVPKVVSDAQLAGYPEGPYVTPLEGTLVKDNDPTVYYISKGQKLPVTAQIFSQRQYAYSQISTVSFSELNSWETGSFLAPAEGSLIKTPNNPTVYWVVGGNLHAVNFQFYLNQGLNIFPLMIVTSGDLASFAKGENYIR